MESKNKARQKYNFSFKLRVIKIVLYFHHFERVSQQICHLDYFLLCHNEVSRRSRMSRLIYIRDNLANR
jgi:hypothetical protein